MCTPRQNVCCICGGCRVENPETWCAVERTKEQDWCRKQRAHISRYQDDMASDIFGFTAVQENIEERCVFEPPKPRRKEQRHFPKIHIIPCVITSSSRMSNYTSSM